MPPKQKSFWSAGTAVVCKHNNVLWKSKIVDVKEADSNDPIYVVHYQGWNSRYDEEIRHSESSQKIFDASEENLALAEENQKTLKGSTSKKGRLDNLTDDEHKKSENGSRCSSPSISSLKGKFTKRRATISPPVGGPDRSSTEVVISLPKALRQLLVNDSDLISKCYLAKVPARFSVEDIIDEYIDNVKGNVNVTLLRDIYIEFDNTSAQLTEATLVCSALGLRDYFNGLLGLQLLYKFERPQYQSLLEKDKAQPEKPRKRKSVAPVEIPLDDFKPAKYYGLIHLLRMLTRLPSVLKLTPWDDRLIKNITQAIHDFTVFLNKNYEKFFNPALDYYVAPTDYYRVSHQ